MPAPSPFLWILLVFTVWMLSDAIRRRAGWFWYLVILVAPLGPVIYFVLVKLPNVATGRSVPGAMGGRGPFAVPNNRLSSSFLTPGLDHADQLEEAERYDEAVPTYQDALASNPNDLQALHGLARCELGLCHPRVAVALLEQVLNIDREYRNYGAALDYADALWLAGQKQDALELLEGLVNATGRVNHRLAYAHYLAQSGDLAKAKIEVQRVIDEHARMTAAEQLRDQRWIERANRMIAEWDSTSEGLAPPE
jgi:hypothetical protein